jgi:hypothetical protein
MNSPFRENAVDLTEIAKTKLHEEAETKRVRLKEREQTKRERIAKIDTTGYMLPRIVVAVGLAVVGIVYFNFKFPSAPDPPKACSETAEIIDEGNHHANWCESGYITTETLTNSTGRVLVKCNCGKKPEAQISIPKEEK